MPLHDAHQRSVSLWDVRYDANQLGGRGYLSGPWPVSSLCNRDSDSAKSSNTLYHSFDRSLASGSRRAHNVSVVVVVKSNQMHNQKTALTSDEIGRRAIGAQAVGTQATGSLAVGALALGAVAIGALAIGRLVIGRLVIRKSFVRSLEIEELNVRRLRVGKLIITDDLITPDQTDR